MPRMATPMVAPTWRIAEIRAEPEPLRSADRADSAAFIVCGIASPRPSPKMANHAAVNQVPLPTVVGGAEPERDGHDRETHRDQRLRVGQG